jgi:uncharacterized protein YcfJ
MALPGSNRTYDEFRADDMQCRQYASQQVGSADNDPAVRSAVIGTLIGAAAGAAIGGNHQGAGVGAGTGLLIGSMVGADKTQRQGYGSQRQYDNVYTQCMYGKGHRVPVAGSMTGRRLPARAPVQTMESGSDVNYPPPPPPSYPAPDSIPPDYQGPR